MYRRLIPALVAVSFVAACASTHAHTASSATLVPSPVTISGTFTAAGGPAEASAVPLSGTITIAGAVTQLQTVGPDGKYTATLPPGTYTVTGTSPQFNDGASTCQTDTGAPVTLAAGQSITADVTCERK